MPRGRRPGAAGQETRERILEAAAVVFARLGYHRAGMEDVMQAAGLSKGGLYFYFAGKEPLFLAVLEQVAGLLQQALSQGRSPADRTEHYLAWLARHPNAARVWQLEARSAGPFAQAAAAAAQGRVEELVAGAHHPTARRAAWLYLTVANRVLEDWLLRQGPEPCSAFAELTGALDLAAEALGPGRPRPRLPHSPGRADSLSLRSLSEPALHWPTW